jgi:REP element-mobilizing transposase RayT
VYHVLSRGVGRADIFHQDRDYETFLDKVEKNAALFKVNVRCYCLMKNHFHLYLQTEEANLSRFMQSLLTAYSMTKNRRDRRTGHLFQGRFKAHLVEDDQYGDTLSRYVHLNPVRTKKVKSLPLEERQRILRDFRWSSYGAVIGIGKCPRWLQRDAVLQRWGKTVKEQQRHYAEYVGQGLLREIDDPFAVAAAQCVIGSDDFVDRIRRVYLNVSERSNVRRDEGQAARLFGWQSFENIQALVASHYGCGAESLLARYQRGNEARQMLLHLVSTYCRGRDTLVELSERLNITVGGLTAGSRVLATQAAKDRGLGRRLRALEKELTQQQES